MFRKFDPRFTMKFLKKNFHDEDVMLSSSAAFLLVFSSPYLLNYRFEFHESLRKYCLDPFSISYIFSLIFINPFKSYIGFYEFHITQNIFQLNVNNFTKNL